MRRADKEVRDRIEQRAKAADRRKEQVVRRIEKGDGQPRPLPGLREDSIEASKSMQSTESADYASAVTKEEANAGRGMIEDMPLEEHMPIDPARA